MKTVRRTSRLSIRLLAFNLLLVFVPIAGVLYLGAYENRLETAEVRAMTQEARIVAAAVPRDGAFDRARFEDIVRRAHAGEVRLRVVDGEGRLLADSDRIIPPPRVQPRGSKRRNTLYRIGAFLARPVVRLVRPPEPPLPVDFYDAAAVLRGPEVVAALHGKEGFDKKISAKGQRSLTLYRAVPLSGAPGAVIASKSTFSILQDLYAVRLGIMRIFLASVVMAVLVSLFYAMTVVAPLRQLRLDARAILDRRTRTRGHFAGSRRLDEIGELSRALERITRRLESHVKFVETFAADVSHELKNPLASIRNANEMLADVGAPEDRRRFVRMINEEVARMEKLLSGVRELTLIGAQLVREEPQAVSVGELLAKIVDGFRLRERERVAFELVLPEEPLIVETSEDRLIQVFENVLDNATSFSPEGGIVRVSATTEGTSIVTRVADEGPGIPPAHLPRIFDRFFTYRPAESNRVGTHTGLGLAIVKTIVEGYGGSIRAANGDRGAVFEIALPRKS